MFLKVAVSVNAGMKKNAILDEARRKNSRHCCSKRCVRSSMGARFAISGEQSTSYYRASGNHRRDSSRRRHLRSLLLYQQDSRRAATGTHGTFMANARCTAEFVNADVVSVCVAALPRCAIRFVNHRLSF